MAIVVKGERDGLVLILPPEGDDATATAELAAYLTRAGAFFKGARVTLDVGARQLSDESLNALLAILKGAEVESHSIRALADTTRAAALAQGMEVPYVVTAADTSPEPAVTAPGDSMEALLVRRTLRSGQSVRYPAAVVVLGDVNPGAEVIAAGDVMVWGALRGLVHAGATGDDTAQVCALSLSADQLRIGNHIASAPDSERASKQRRFWQKRATSGTGTGPERARVQDGTIVIERWPTKERTS